MSISAPTYNIEIVNENFGMLKKRSFKNTLNIITTRFNSYDLTPSIINSIELSASINKQNVLSVLNEFEITEEALAKILYNDEYVGYLKTVQEKIPFYLENYKLKLVNYIDEEEDYSVLNIIVFCNLDYKMAIKIEDTFFIEIFEKIYRNSQGKITFRIENYEV